MRSVFLSVFFTLLFFVGKTQDSSAVSNEIIYGHKDGMALTLFVQQPSKSAKGKAVINLVNGNWTSGMSRSAGYFRRAQTFADRGYTVFTILTSSQPRYNIFDEVSDVKRAVRFVRYHAKDYHIDPDKIGITGSSSGGHLSLMTATASDSVIQSSDPVDKVSSRVQAAGVFFPPTDFWNYGQEGYNAQASEMFITMARLGGAFDFKVFDQKLGVYQSVTDSAGRRILAGQASPIYQVSSDDPPIIIFHGDQDRLVPKQQSEKMVEALKKVGVTSRLVIKEGGNHGWPAMEAEENQIADWFDLYLK